MTGKQDAQHHHGAQASDQDHGELRSAAFHATLHCAIGCTAGEVIGVAVGVSAGLGVWGTMALGTVLAFIIGLSLASFPLARRMEITPLDALKMIWLGECASILMMEVAMNAVDYAMGGMSTGTIFTGQFWVAMIAAVPVGFAAAYPVNYVMIGRGIAEHHH